MKVTLVNYTVDAVNLLLRTKNTRLKVEGDDPADWPEERRIANLKHMLQTNPGSWEFVDYVFLVEGISRNTSLQMVRTRQASYAQQSQRVVDMSEAEFIRPDSIPMDSLFSAALAVWDKAAMDSRHAYRDLHAAGIPEQDARDVLMSSAETSLYAKYNLRTLSNMALVRLCTRTQGPYQRVFREMREEVLSVHPWAEDFLQVECVASGRCAFPAVGPKSCPHWIPELDATETQAKMKARFWAVPLIELDPAKTVTKQI